jgi:hypothetical protein
MSRNVRHGLISWIDQRLDDMLQAPRMWGSRESVELQSLLLVELKAFVRHPSHSAEKPRYAVDAYLNFLRQHFPSRPNLPLHELLDEQPESAFTDKLVAFRSYMDQLVLDENPFEHSELAIDLTFSSDREPNATAFTSYYEEFRRATRAIVGSGKSGRPTKSVETATDFSIEDVRVTPKNGKPASALLVLGPPVGQQDFEVQRLVRDGLAGLVTMTEWADTNSELKGLAMDDLEGRTRTAVQALRVVPRRGIQSVRIGGKLIGRVKPIELRPEQEKRFVEVIGAGTSPEAFDVEDEVRAIDLDRGVLRLGKKAKTTCYVRPDHFANVAEVGVRVRVVGSKFRPLNGSPFVLVAEVLPVGKPAESKRPA